MIAATSATIIEKIGNRVRIAIALSDGRTITTSGKGKDMAKAVKQAVQTANKAAAAAPAHTPFELAYMGVNGGTGIWSAEMTNAIATIEARAIEAGNTKVSSIARQFIRTHQISTAQKQVLAAFAVANNITF